MVYVLPPLQYIIYPTVSRYGLVSNHVPHSRQCLSFSLFQNLLSLSSLPHLNIAMVLGGLFVAAVYLRLIEGKRSLVLLWSSYGWITFALWIIPSVVNLPCLSYKICIVSQKPYLFCYQAKKFNKTNIRLNSSHFDEAFFISFISFFF